MSRSIDPERIDDWSRDYAAALRGMEAALRLAGLDPRDPRLVNLPTLLLTELVEQLPELLADGLG
jgi:hypothetical protein